MATNEFAICEQNYRRFVQTSAKTQPLYNSLPNFSYNGTKKLYFVRKIIEMRCYMDGTCFYMASFAYKLSLFPVLYLTETLFSQNNCHGS